MYHKSLPRRSASCIDVSPLIGQFSKVPILIGLSLELYLGQTGKVGLIGYKLHYFKRGGGVNISQLSMIQLKMINYKSTTELFLFPPNYSHISSPVESFTEH